MVFLMRGDWLKSISELKMLHAVCHGAVRGDGGGVVVTIVVVVSVVYLSLFVIWGFLYLYKNSKPNQAKPKLSFCVGAILIPLVRTTKRLWLCANVREDANKNRTEPKPFIFFCERTVHCGLEGLAPPFPGGRFQTGRGGALGAATHPGAPSEVSTPL